MSLLVFTIKINSGQQKTIFKQEVYSTLNTDKEPVKKRGKRIQAILW